MEETSKKNINIQLGDIIDFEAIKDNIFHNVKFFVKYIDTKKLILVSENNDEETLFINNEGYLSNDKITNINILYREKEKSYSKQNGLIPGVWIDIQFDGNIPMIITGEITNLDEDQIEIKTTNNDIIYIDFGYKGIPIDLPIKKITIRNSPLNIKKQVIEETSKDEESKDEEEEKPSISLNEDIDKQLFEADQISFGEDLDEITQVINIPEFKKIYNIDKQTNDMLNDFLSNIPNINRTQSVINNFHIMINRYVQLRKEYSIFDENNNVSSFIKKGSEYKPLVNSLQNLNQKLYWLIPVTKNIKKIYNSNIDDEDSKYIIQTKLVDSLLNMEEINDKFMENKSQDAPNKYNSFLQEINEHYIPFEYSKNKENIIATKEINTSLNALIDNFDDFYSNVVENKNVIRKKFVLQTYSMGLKKNDKIDIKSFITLPIKVLNFSHINLPKTNILHRANLNLNFILLWKILNKRTNVNTEIITDIDKPLEFNKNTYLNNITEYTIDSDIIQNSKLEKNLLYEKFLNTIIPKTRVLFNLIKKNVTEKLTVYDIVNYLEPFMIYSNDISYMQYVEFVNFIKEKTIEYKKRYVENIRNLNNMYINSQEHEIILHSIIKSNEKIFNDILENYNIPNDNSLTNEEILSRMSKLDNCNLYNMAICILTIKLKLTNNILDINSLINEKEEIKDECNNYIITKKYITMEDLENDNGIDIYYDKEYDKTFYDLINEYDYINEIIEDYKIKIEFLSQKLQEINGLNEKDSIREATAIINKERLVEEGEYAILETDNNVIYFKRQDKTWIQDKNINNNDICNSNLKCITKNNNCENISNTLQINKYKEILTEFDSNLDYSKEEINKIINNKYNKALQNIKKNKKIVNIKNLKYNKEKRLIAGTLEINDLNISPYEKIASLILGESDIIKKYDNIKKFIQLYTREAYISENEDSMWLYCITTNVKLLPLFIKKLSDAFNTNNSKLYLDTIDKICKEQGTISDDEAFWIDKHSGYNIVPINFSNQDDYDEQGFRIKTNEILQEKEIKINKVYDSPLASIIITVVNAFTNFTGIIISNENMEFIIANVISNSENSKIIPSKKLYEAKINKNKQEKKRYASYEKYKKKQIIIFTLSYLLIIIQTNIPSIKINKQFPGCKSSFKGYPLENDEEKILGIKFVACVINNIKSSIEPWDSIKNMNEKKIIDEMLNNIKKFIIVNPSIRKKIIDKIEYFKVKPDIDDEENINFINWHSFLPVLTNVKLDNVNNITKEFVIELKEDIKKNSVKQHEKLQIIRGKIILYTLKIQEVIQNIIIKKNTILLTNSKQPFLENACCNENNLNSLEYFSNIKPEIINYNNNNAYMEDLLDDINNLSKPPFIFSPENTKNIIPKLEHEYSEETIYQAFITHCNFNTDFPIDPVFYSVCLQKPENYNKNNSIEKNISILKENGVNYSKENLIQLINIINKKNILKINFTNVTISNIQTYKNILQNVDETLLPNEFINNMFSMLDSYDNSNLTEYTQEMKNIKLVLNNENSKMKDIIINFLKDNTTIKKNDSIIDCIKNIMKFNINKETDEEKNIINKDNSTFSSIEFIKNVFRDICIVYPNMILNKIDYSEINIPNHWKLSVNHNNDIYKFISNYYKSLKQFYHDDKIELLFNKIIPKLNIINELAQNTYFYSSTFDNDTHFFSIFNNDICEHLFIFYFYSIIIQFINILDDEELYNIEYSSEEDEDDLSYVISSEKSSLNKNVANLILAIIKIICNDKDKINYSYEMLMNKIYREKEKEKDNIVETLKNMTTEEREIENLFKNNKLGKWSKGLQKGLRVYEGKTYDEEKKIMEQQMILDAKLGESTNDINSDILAMEMTNENFTREQIESEEYSLNHLGEDDDYGNLDGDEYY